MASFIRLHVVISLSIVGHDSETAHDNKVKKKKETQLTYFKSHGSQVSAQVS